MQFKIQDSGTNIFALTRFLQPLQILLFKLVLQSQLQAINWWDLELTLICALQAQWERCLDSQNLLIKELETVSLQYNLACHPRTGWMKICKKESQKSSRVKLKTPLIPNTLRSRWCFNKISQLFLMEMLTIMKKFRFQKALIRRDLEISRPPIKDLV